MPLDRAIFIMYQPGSYGSFLSHAINFSDDLFNSKFKTVNIFDPAGAAHFNVKEYILRFHDGDKLEKWYKMSQEEAKNYLDKAWHGTPALVESGKFYTQRCALPYAYDKIMYFFPQSKFVNISFEDDDQWPIARAFAKKTLDTFLMNKITFEREEYNKLKSMPMDQLLEHYASIAVKMMGERPRIKQVSNMFDFEFKWFYDRKKFMHGYNKMCEFFEIQPGDVTALYEEFCIVNNIKEQ